MRETENNERNKGNVQLFLNAYKAVASSVYFLEVQ